MATSSTSLWGAMGRGQGKLRESWNGLCVGAWAVGLWEGPLNAPGPRESPLPLACSSGQSTAGQGLPAW